MQMKLGALKLGPTLHYVRSIGTTMDALRVGHALPDDGPRQSVIRLHAGVVDELAERAVRSRIEYDLPLAPRPPRRARVGEEDTGRGGRPTIESHQPEAKVLAPRHRNVAHRAVADDGRGVRFLLAPDRRTRGVKSGEVVRAVSCFEAGDWDDRQIGIALAISGCPPDDHKRSSGRQTRHWQWFRFGMHRHREESSGWRLGDGAKRLERRWKSEPGEHRTIGRPILRVVGSDGDVHLICKANAASGRFEGPHADAGRLDGQVWMADDR